MTRESPRQSAYRPAEDAAWRDAGKPGARSAPHSHEEFEQVFVLSGSFHDGERLLSAGDYCSRAPGEVHEAATDEGATALVIYTPP